MTAKGKTPKKAPPRPTVREAPWLGALEKRGAGFAVLVLGLLLVVFFAPVFFGGKTFETVDHVAYAAHAPFLRDAARGEGSWLDRFPLWNPYVFSGMPAYGSLLIGPYITPAAVLLGFVPEIPRMILLYLVLGFGTWLLARRLGMSVFPALLAALVFVFSTQVITLVMFGHHLKLTTLVFLPYVLLATEALFGRPTWIRALLLAVALGVMLLSAHFQIVAYALLASIVLGLVASSALARGGAGAWKVACPWLLWGGAVFVGIVLASSLLLPVREYAASSTRGGLGGGVDFSYATRWSLNPVEVLTLFTPAWFGYGQGTYWGWMPFTDYPFYFGVVPLLLAVLAVILWPRERIHLTFVVLFGLALLLAFGSYFPLYRLCFEIVPFFDKFRVPSMIFLLAGLAVALLAGRALDRLAALGPGPEAARVRRVFSRVVAAFAVIQIGLLAAAGAGLPKGAAEGQLLAKARERYAAELMTASPTLPPDVVAGARSQAQAAGALATRDAALTLVVFALGAGLLWLRLGGKLGRPAFLVLLLVLVTADLWRVGLRPAPYVPRRSPPTAFHSSPALDFLLADKEPYRVFPLIEQGITNNWLAWFRIPSVLGYHPAKLGIYQDLTDDAGKVGFRNTLLAGNTHLLDILNARYVLTDREIPLPEFQLVHRSTHLVYRNTHSLPRLWFVDRARVLPDPTTHLATIADPAWNPATDALLFENPGPLDPGRTGRARITRLDPRRVEALVESPGNCLLVVSEIYYEPGWTARLDDREVPILRADYALRAVRVPPGRHVLSMRFDSPTLRRGLVLSATAFGAVGAALAAGLLLGRRRRTATGTGTENGGAS